MLEEKKTIFMSEMWDFKFSQPTNQPIFFKLAPDILIFFSKIHHHEDYFIGKSLKTVLSLLYFCVFDIFFFNFCLVQKSLFKSSQKKNI